MLPGPRRSRVCDLLLPPRRQRPKRAFLHKRFLVGRWGRLGAISVSAFLIAATDRRFPTLRNALISKRAKWNGTRPIYISMRRVRFLATLILTRRAANERNSPFALASISTPDKTALSKNGLVVFGS